MTVEWNKDFRLRCNYGDAWVDFFFDIGGPNRQLSIERKPVGQSDGVSSPFCEQALGDLTSHLKSLGYDVILVPT